MIFRILSLIALFSFLSGGISLSWAGVISKIKPYMSVKQEYTDNLNLTATHEKEDFITTIEPGVAFSNQGKKFSADLNYVLGANFYSQYDNLNYISHNASLNARYRATHRTSIDLREYFIRSDNPREQEYFTLTEDHEYVAAVKTERSVYWRNVVEPKIEYQFGHQNRMGVSYRNNIYRTESDTGEDSQEDYINPFLSYRFNRQNEIFIEYGRTYGDFDNSPDLKGHRANCRYTNYIGPNTSAFVSYTYLDRDYDAPSTSDYKTNEPSIGVTVALSPSLTAGAQLGYYWSDLKAGSRKNGLSYTGQLTKTDPRTNYTLNLRGGYSEDLFTSENLGFNRYNALSASVNHGISRRLSVGCRGSLKWANYEQTPEHDDTTWEIMGTGSYDLLKWLNLALSLSHKDRSSDIDSYEYTENSVILKLRGEYF